MQRSQALNAFLLFREEVIDVVRREFFYIKEQSIISKLILEKWNALSAAGRAWYENELLIQPPELSSALRSELDHPDLQKLGDVSLGRLPTGKKRKGGRSLPPSR